MYSKEKTSYRYKYKSVYKQKFTNSKEENMKKTKFLFINNKKVFGNIKTCVSTKLEKQGLLDKVDVLEIEFECPISLNHQVEISQNINELDKEIDGTSDLHLIWTSFHQATLYYAPSKHNYLLIDE